jgi:diguanylate cyclase (GGDEF)-like protein/PAS domain S-box-containing protein
MKYDYTDLLENLCDGVYFTDHDRKITFWNKASERITGFTAGEVIGQHCSDNILIHVDGKGNSLCLGLCPLAESIRDGVSREAEVYLHHKRGHRVPVWVRTTPLRDESGRIVGGAELFTDISPQTVMRAKIEELEKLALLDGMTQIANRSYIEMELESRLAEMKRYRLSFGILFMDIDNFKHVNDTHGHETGDLLLKAIADTLTHTFRPFDLFGRWGGEEFIGIIRNIDMPALADIGNRIRMLVSKTQIQVPGSLLSITVSIGATMATPDDTRESLMKRADMLLYKSKNKGKNCMTAE